MQFKLITTIIFAVFLVACSDSDESTSPTSESAVPAKELIEESAEVSSGYVEESKDVVSGYTEEAEGVIVDAKETAQGYIDDAKTESVDTAKDDLMDQVSENVETDEMEEQANSAAEALKGLK